MYSVLKMNTIGYILDIQNIFFKKKKICIFEMNSKMKCHFFFPRKRCICSIISCVFEKFTSPPTSSQLRMLKYVWK